MNYFASPYFILVSFCEPWITIQQIVKL
jgi:hypothetical protein